MCVYHCWILKELDPNNLGFMSEPTPEKPSKRPHLQAWHHEHWAAQLQSFS